MPVYPIDKLEPKRVIISLGGSLIVPNEINVEYLKAFRKFILSWLQKDFKFVIITGGGAPARQYIDAATAVLDNDLTDDDKDWLGIHATRFNGHLVRTIFRHEARAALIIHPEEDELDTTKPILVGAGWKPGWSTDYVANKLAQRYGAPVVINLSNIKQVYESDPKLNPDAKPIEEMVWADFRKIVGDTWTPGMNLPYDPIASKLAQEAKTTVLVMDGNNLENLQQCFEGKPFFGTKLY